MGSLAAFNRKTLISEGEFESYGAYLQQLLDVKVGRLDGRLAQQNPLSNGKPYRLPSPSKVKSF